MRVQATERFRRVVDRRCKTGKAGNAARIAHLATAFAVKWRLVGNQGYAVTSLGGLHFSAILDQRHNLPFAFAGGVAGKFGRTDAFGNIEPDFVRSLGTRTLPGCTGAFFLLRHFHIETFAVDAKTLRAQCVFGQVIGEAICIVELERGFAR